MVLLLLVQKLFTLSILHNNTPSSDTPQSSADGRHEGKQEAYSAYRTCPSDITKSDALYLSANIQNSHITNVASKEQRTLKTPC